MTFCFEYLILVEGKGWLGQDKLGGLDFFGTKEGGSALFSDTEGGGDF